MNKRIFTLFFMLLLVSAGFAQKQELDYKKMIMDTALLKKDLPLVDQLLAKRGETRYVIPSFVPFRIRYNSDSGESIDKKYYNGLTFSKDLYEKAMEGDATSQLKIFLCGYFLYQDTQGIDVKDMLKEAVNSGNIDARFIYARIYKQDTRQNQYERTRDIKELASNLYGPACYYLYENETSSWTEQCHNLWSALLAKYPQAYYTAGSIAMDQEKGAIALWFFNEAKKLGWDFTDKYEKRNLYNA